MLVQLLSMLQFWALGERAGICDLITLAAILDKHYNLNHYNFKHSQDLAQAIARIASNSIEHNHPIVGRNSFTHVSKYHVKAADNNPQSYEALDPEYYGRSRSFTVNVLERKDQQRLNSNLIVKTPFIKVHLNYYTIVMVLDLDGFYG